MEKILKEIEARFTQLYFTDPLFAIISAKMEKIPTNHVPTIGVGPGTFGIINFVYNPKFVDKLIQDQKERGIDYLSAVIKHEFYHILLKHIYNGKMDELTNIAMDIVINQTIDNLPEGCCSLNSIPYNGKMFVFDKPLDPNLSWYQYRKILQDILPPEDKKGGNDSDNGSDKNGSDSGSDKNGSDSGSDKNGSDSGSDSGSDKNGSDSGSDNGSDKNGSDKNGSHENWKETKDPIIDKVIENAIKEAIKTNKWGSVPGDLKEMLKASIRKDVSWQDYLKILFNSIIKCEFESSRKIYNRRLGNKYPGLKRKFGSKLALCLDTSGSMDSKNIEKLVSNCNNLAKNFNVDIEFIQFDTEIQSIEKVYKYNENLVVKGRGGTDLDKLFNYLNTQKFDGIVILTDGYFSTPNQGKYNKKVLWVFTDTINEEVKGMKVKMNSGTNSK